MATLPSIAVQRDWYCPNCRVEARSNEARPHSKFHRCRAAFGLTAPLVEKGVRAKVEFVAREDYIGKDVVTMDGNGRPVMSVVTTRENGQDTAVFAPHVAAKIGVV
jgi:hypothetical protein